MSGLSGMLLRIQIWIRNGRTQHFEPRVGCEQLSHQLAPMPGSTIPQQRDALDLIGGQHLFQVLNGGCAIHVARFDDDFAATVQVKGAVKAGLSALRISSHHR